jgi:hypothetical protein
MNLFASARDARRPTTIEPSPSSSLGATAVDDIESQLAGLFETAASHLEAPVEEIVGVSTRLGRKRRARRNTAMVTATVGVVGLTAGVVFSVQRFGSGAMPSSAAASEPKVDRSASAPATPRPGSAADTTAANSATAALPPASGLVRSTPDSGPQVGAPLLARLVSGFGLHAVRQNSISIGVADVIYDDGHGQSEVIASVRAYSAALKSWNAYTCANFSATDEGRRPSGAPAPSCTTVTTTGGHVEYVIVTADDGSGFYDYEVNLFTADNMVVSLDAGNGVPRGATVDVTRAVPPLSLAEMQAVVADPGWLGYTDPAS